MRFGNWKTALFALALAGVLGSSARATDWFGQYHAIPREVPAIDFRTGAPMYAPPVPYGSYAKDYPGAIHGAFGHITGAVHKVIGKAADGVHMLCGMCGGKGCATCAGSGLAAPANGCGNAGCGVCAGKGGVFATGYETDGAGHKGLFGHRKGGWLPSNPNGVTIGNGGLPVGGGHCGTTASPQSPYPTSQVAPSAQAAAGKHGKSGLCGDKKCKLFHGDPGLGLCNSDPGLPPNMAPCGGCGGNGCGACKGLGSICNNCGGQGCSLCGHLLGKAHNAAGLVHGAVAKIFHIGEIKYFTGPGGPVPITPGYVPYVVPTRSPRDFFAFPPNGNGVAPDY